MAKKGDWVQIHNIVLTPEERSSALPEDTKSHPLEMWVKGYLQQRKSAMKSKSLPAPAVMRRANS